MLAVTSGTLLAYAASRCIANTATALLAAKQYNDPLQLGCAVEAVGVDSHLCRPAMDAPLSPRFRWQLAHGYSGEQVLYTIVVSSAVSGAVA